MIVTCAKCGTKHDVSRRKPGEAFNCACGNALARPPSKSVVWIVLLVVGLVLVVPCIGILAAIAIPNFIRYQYRAKATEARTMVRSIARAEQSYYEANGRYLPAGAVPASVPGRERKTATADASFKQLGISFDTPVYYQYRVEVSGERARVIANGDLNGNGALSTYEIAVTPEDIGPLETQDELE